MIGTAVKLATYVTHRNTLQIIEQALRDFADIDATHVQGGIARAMRDVEALRGIHIVMVDTTDEPDPLHAVREFLDICPPSLAIIVLGDRNDIRLYRKMLDAGASEYLFTPLKVHLVTKCLREWIPQTRDARLFRRGKVVLVSGVRGACGASTIAMRLARKLSLNPPRPVLLVDFDFKKGDIALQCDLSPNTGLYSAAAADMEIDEAFLTRTVARLETDLHLMATLAPIETHAELTQDFVTHLLEQATSRYRYVVGELAADHIATALPLVSTCETMVLVSDARLSSARDVERWRSWIAERDDAPALIHVLNMAGARNALPLDEFSRAAGRQPDLVLPYIPKLSAGSVLGLMHHEAYRDFDEKLGQLLARIALVQPARQGVLDRLARFLGRRTRAS